MTSTAFSKQAVCFHGTTASGAAAILRDGFRLSTNPWDWLGKGIYFFEAAPFLAWEWANDYIERHGIDDDPAVISATINLEKSIDMLDDVWDDALKAAAQELDTDGSIARQHGLRLRSAKHKNPVVVCDYPMPLTSNRRNLADCQIIDAVWGQLKDKGFIATSVRAPFVIGQQLFSNSYLFDESHVQVAVIDPSVISNVARVV